MRPRPKLARQLKLRMQKPHLMADKYRDQGEEKEKALRDLPGIDLEAIEPLR